MMTMPVLQTARLTLLRLSEGDAAFIHRLLNPDFIRMSEDGPELSLMGTILSHGGIGMVRVRV